MTPIHGLILAGGEGSRLAAEGYPTPKALVPIRGRPLVVSQVETLARLGCSTVTVMVREEFHAAVERAIAETRVNSSVSCPVTVAPCQTPTSAHTLVAGMARVPAGPVFCTMVDTVMPPTSWARAYGETVRDLAAGADAVLIVTPFVHDESPLYAVRGREGLVSALESTPGADRVVTGGVYGFGVAARKRAAEAVDEGVRRMRGFLQRLIAGGARVTAVEIEKIVDLDRIADLTLVNQWLEQSPDWVNTG